MEISIHALLAESDAVFVLQITFFDIFLSTLSLRRATLLYHFCPVGDKHFYPRSPCGERHSYSQHVIRPSGYFYPRSPCGERPIFFIIFNACCTFLSTLSLRRATQRHKKSPCKALISIHALLAESDQCGTPMYTAPSPFLSTLSLRRATAVSSPRRVVSKFLSTLSLRRATRASQSYSLAIIHFYPRSPCGERPPTRAL